jgi:hypothetical protein
MELPGILSEARVKDAAELLRRYYLVPDEKTVYWALAATSTNGLAAVTRPE